METRKITVTEPPYAEGVRNELRFACGNNIEWKKADEDTDDTIYILKTPDNMHSVVLNILMVAKHVGRIAEFALCLVGTTQFFITARHDRVPALEIYTLKAEDATEAIGIVRGLLSRRVKNLGDWSLGLVRIDDSEPMHVYSAFGKSAGGAWYADHEDIMAVYIQHEQPEGIGKDD